MYIFIISAPSRANYNLWGWGPASWCSVCYVSVQQGLRTAVSSPHFLPSSLKWV